jgi:hypothetical protein
MPYTACYSSSATVAWHTSFINNNAQQVETLVQECLDSSVDKLKMLPDSRLALALEDFVEKQVSTCVCIYYLHMLIRQHLFTGCTYSWVQTVCDMLRAAASSQRTLAVRQLLCFIITVSARRDSSAAHANCV